MRLAILSDVHGNADALEAVLDDLGRESVDAVVCLGDHVSGPFEPGRAAGLLIAAGVAAIAGNHDRYILERPHAALGAVDRIAADDLSVDQRRWLAGLPKTLILDDVFACHGTPTSDETQWLERIEGERQVLADSAAIEAVAATRPAAALHASLILCGHSHIARQVRLASGAQVVNPGSVGGPGYRAAGAGAHVMQTGSPDARYAIAERWRDGWRVALVSVPYDRARAVRLADGHGLGVWRQAVESGWLA